MSAARPKHNLAQLAQTGFWFCDSCERITEREEKEQGQPAVCAGCQSMWVRWVLPLDQKPGLFGQSERVSR